MNRRQGRSRGRAAYAANFILDRVIMAILIACTLVGAYSIYDALYLYGMDAGRLYYYLPFAGRASAESVPEDAVGWLSVDDTGLEYPVMQGKDNSAYLNRDADGTFSLAGSIFLDYRSDPSWRDDYNLLYGHHMSGGRMFGALDRFLDPSYFDAHRNGMLKTERADFALRLFAVVEEEKADGALFACGNEVRITGRESDIRDHARIWRSPETGKILAMSTCMESGSTRRLLVLASMKEIRTPGSLRKMPHGRKEFIWEED